MLSHIYLGNLSPAKVAGYRARSGLIGLAVDRNELVKLAPEALIKADCAKINRVHWDSAPDAQITICKL